MPRVALLALLLPLPAFAGGYYYPDSGIIAFGRGGAFVAGARGQNAQYYNPAGLVRTERPTLNVGVSGVQQNVTFEREGFEPADNEATPFVIPQFGFAMPIRDDMGFAFGFYSPFAPDYLYDEDGPQRYTIIDSVVWNISIGPSYAWAPIPEVAIGVGLQWQVLRVEERLKVTYRGDDDPSGDIAVDARTLDVFTPMANFGVIVEPIDEIAIGLSVQPPTKFKARGSGELDFSGSALASALDETVYTDDDIALNISLPLVLRGGIAVRPVDGLEIELASVFEQWSVLEDILVEDIDVTVSGDLIGEQPVAEELALPAGFRNVASLRLGAEFSPDPMYGFRLGGFYETGSLEASKVSVALYDTEKFQLGGGASFLFADHLGLDLSAAYLYFPNLTVTDSEVTQINVEVINDDTAIVGNGDYRSNGWMVGGQLSWAFGPKPQ